MVGGEKEVFDKCLPLFEVLGSNIVHVGEVGMGQTCKACNQLFCALHMLACCEGIALAKKAGLDPQTMVEVVSSGAGGSWALANLGPKIIKSDFEPGFMIDLLSKDLHFTMELAQAGQLPLPGAALAQQLFHAAQADDLGAKGTQALYRIIEKLGNITEK
jgi:3-hydroxyisobutyrate dehydrogenase